MENWDIYDENMNKTNRTCKRDEYELKNGEYHISVQIWIKNSKDEILLTQRAEDKKKYKLLWEPTSGAVKAGENSIQGALRELKEEIGLEISKEELQLLELYKINEKHVYLYVYTLNKDVDINELKFVDNEVINAKWVDSNELRKMYENNELVPAIALSHFLL